MANGFSVAAYLLVSASPAAYSLSLSQALCCPLSSRDVESLVPGYSRRRISEWTFRAVSPLACS